MLPVWQKLLKVAELMESDPEFLLDEITLFLTTCPPTFQVVVYVTAKVSPTAQWWRSFSPGRIRLTIRH